MARWLRRAVNTMALASNRSTTLVGSGTDAPSLKEFAEPLPGGLP